MRAMPFWYHSSLILKKRCTLATPIDVGPSKVPVVWQHWPATTRMTSWA